MKKTTWWKSVGNFLHPSHGFGGAIVICEIWIIEVLVKRLKLQNLQEIVFTIFLVERTIKRVLSFSFI